MKQPGTGRRRPTIEECRAQANARLERLKKHPGNLYAQVMIECAEYKRGWFKTDALLFERIALRDKGHIIARLGK